jgi:hypothetical protein
MTELFHRSAPLGINRAMRPPNQNHIIDAQAHSNSEKLPIDPAERYEFHPVRRQIRLNIEFLPSGVHLRELFDFGDGKDIPDSHCII